MAYTVVNNSPSVGYISWSDLHLQFQGVNYDIANGNTNKKYSYWTLGTPNNLVSTDTFPTLTNDDCLIFLNKLGVAIVVPTSTALPGDLIVPGTITAAALAAGAVTANAIYAGSVNTNALAANAVTAAKILAGSITADKLFIADMTNLAKWDPIANPSTYTVVTINDLKYFKVGPNAYSSIFFASSNMVEFKVDASPTAVLANLGLQTGIVATTLPNNGTRTGTVTFPIPYAAGVTPNIQLTLSGIVGSYDRPMKLAVTALSNTGFTWSLTYAASSNNACNVHWLAIGDSV